MIDKTLKLLNEKQLTISFAESMTGGLLSSKLTELPGASIVFKGSIVAYSNEIKNRVLYIDSNDIKTYGVVSKEIAQKMATSVLKLFNTNISVGITGDAGPTNQEGKNDRHAYYAICHKESCEIYHLKFSEETRIEAQQKTVDEIYRSLKLFIEKKIGI